MQRESSLKKELALIPIVMHTLDITHPKIGLQGEEAQMLIYQALTYRCETQLVITVIRELIRKWTYSSKFNHGYAQSQLRC